MYTMCNESYWDNTKFDIRIEQFLKCQYLFLCTCIDLKAQKTICLNIGNNVPDLVIVIMSMTLTKWNLTIKVFVTNSTKYSCNYVHSNYDNVRRPHVLYCWT